MCEYVCELSVMKILVHSMVDAQSFFNSYWPALKSLICKHSHLASTLQKDIIALFQCWCVHYYAYDYFHFHSVPNLIMTQNNY